MEYLELFWSFIQVGLTSFGGGYAAIPLIQEQIVDMRGWMTLVEFNDVLTISQLTPGPVALNAATFVGTKVLGVGGAVLATIGCVLPSLVIVVLLAFIYFKFTSLQAIQGLLYGLRPAVIALIASAGLTMILSSLFAASGVSDFNITNIDYIALVIFIPSVIVLIKFKINPIIIMLASGVVGGALYLLF